MADIENMETTDDRMMVRVDMADEGARKSEPIGRFMGIDQALSLEAQGKCVIRRKNQSHAQYETTPDGKVMVEHLQKPLIDSYGRYAAYTPGDAEKGEQTRKWKRVMKGGMEERVEPEIHGLSYEDVYGPRSSTRIVKKKRVAWVQDNFMRGGAEISAELVIRSAIDCGFEVEVITPSKDAGVMEKILFWSDVIIINNIWGFSQAQMKVLLTAVYAERIPYVKYEHDHRELDRLEFSRRLFQNSRLNVFLSPVHLSNHKEVLGCEGIALPLAIDVDFFKPVPGIERRSGAALAGNLRHFKQWSILQKYVNDHPEIEFTLIGDPVVTGANVRIREKVAYEQMPALYSEFEYLVHLLDGWGAGERVVFEACLIGCAVIANDHVGHMSWGKDLTKPDELRPWLKEAPLKFWRAVDRAIA